MSFGLTELTSIGGQPLVRVSLAPGSQPMSVAALVATRFGIEDARTRQKLAEAIDAVIRGRRPAAVLWRGWVPSRGQLIHVRPARERGSAIVTMTSLDSAASLDPAILTDLFELTRAEAEIATQLFERLDLADVASVRQVRNETVRGQVKTIMRKAGVASQKELLVLLSKIAFADTAAAVRQDHRTAVSARRGEQS